MSEKFFSLISGEEVRIKPGEKIIPAHEFSTLKSADELLRAAKNQIAEALQEAREKGFKEGFEEGLSSLNQHILALDQELKVLRKEVQEKILPLSLKAARKIMGEELKMHPDRIVDIVLNSLRPVTQHRKIIIYANKTDLQHLEEEKPKLKKIFEHLDSLSIQERDDIEPGGCMIETEAGIINAQLETQWRALESAFESFMKK
jgi:type III secretion protein L